MQAKRLWGTRRVGGGTVEEARMGHVGGRRRWVWKRDVLPPTHRAGRSIGYVDVLGHQSNTLGDLCMIL